VGIGDLLAALERDADAEVQKIWADAEARAGEILAAATRARAARLDQETAAYRQERELASANQIADAGARARRELLTIRAEMLDRLRAAVRARLPELLDRGDLVDALTTSALATAGDAVDAIHCSPALTGAIAARVGELPVEPLDDGSSGLRVILAGDRGHVDATLEALLDRAWPGLQIAALTRLAAEEPA
jgi:vacuolar-type H+-ATPase subunit E/Vma4